MPNDDKRTGASADLESLAKYFDSTSLADMDSGEVSVEPAPLPMVSRSIRMEQATMSQIRKVAKRRGIPVTQLMRQWIQKGLAQEMKADGPLAENREEVVPSGAPLLNVQLGKSRPTGHRVAAIISEATHAPSRESVTAWRIERRLSKYHSVRSVQPRQLKLIDVRKNDLGR